MKGVQIRPFRDGDAEALFAAVDESRAALNPWLPWCHDTYSIEDSRQWVQGQIAAFPAGTTYSFVIIDDADRLLGGCGLNRLDLENRGANLGYWVRSSETRRGVASEAARQLVAWAFAQTQIERLEVLASVENTASRRAAEKAGAAYEGMLRRRLLLRGRMHDCAVYSFVRTQGMSMEGTGSAGARFPT